MKLSPTENFRDKNVFFIGATGFVGKVTLCMLLHRFPNVGRVYVTVRARGQEESETRFWNSVVTSPTFDPLRERFGEAFEEFIKDKIRIVGGDVGDKNLGYTEEQAQQLADDIDIVINSAGNVTFNPSLESALRTNVVGTRNVIEFAKRMKRPALVHVSTCFVAGKRSGPVWESDPVIGFFPRKDELPGVEFSAEEEIENCERLAARVRDEAKDSLQAARFRESARERLNEEGRDADDLDAMGLAVARERKLWTRERLTELGIERAQFWGWDNIYTYTKSLGEQLVAKEDGVVKAIVRPSIVESAVSFPFPGWNEGFTTTAPLIFITLKGQSQIPVNENLILDITPVDQVAAVMLMAAAQVLEEEPRLVFQAATGDSNPNEMKRIVGLLGLYKRQHFTDKETGFRFINELAARMEAKPVTQTRFDRTSTPMVNATAKRVSGLLDRVRPRWGGGRLTDVIDGVKEQLESFERVTHETKEAFGMFRPFMIENAYIFRADNVRSLYERVRKDEQHLLPWQPEKLDWYDYWMNVHFPGLKKWVFPTLEDEMREKPKRVYTHRDLVELFETATKRHATRVAMRIERDGIKEQYTYADVRELSYRAAAFLIAREVKAGDRVLLFSDNAPEWGMSYFGVVRAGATCVPVDAGSTTDELVNFTRASAASGIIISQKKLDEHADLRSRLDQAELNETNIWTFDEVFRLEDEAVETDRLSLLPAKVPAQSIASIIFTSGTTGTPKGVMLSHKNLVNMTSMLTSVFDMSTRDGVLSVLPLHHTFEFSTGFLAPFSRGTQITYLPELNGEELARAIKNGYITGMVGVPALWELLHRRIKNRLYEQHEYVGRAADLLIEANSWLRNKTPLNLGHVIFRPIHQGMGGRIRYLISGGSAMNDKLKKDFHGLGFSILEGYGLTEASPVLTVVRPQNKIISGSVGRPLPGVEVRIEGANEFGVGEVIARGANVMVGYYANEDATKQVLIDRWLRTGDLGKLDGEGNLYLVGRSKDLIVDTNGKNVYPDEIEELYVDSPFVKELSVVGISESLGEKVACLVVPDYDADIALSRGEVKRKIEEHFKTVSSTLPFYKRVKVLHFTDDELPRNSTRKVRRGDVTRTLEKLEQKVRESGNVFTTTAGAEANAQTKARGKKDEAAWLLEIVARVANRPRREVTLNSRLGDLGFDSLMFVELGAAIEAAGAELTSPDTLNEIQDVRELLTVIRSPHEATSSSTSSVRATEEPRATFTTEQPRAETSRGDVAGKRQAAADDEIYIPSFIRAVGNQGLDKLQRVFYERLLHSRYEGRGNIPAHTNFLVAANHSSHLDMGLVKLALGDAGTDLVALAAADYFFDNKFKRAYMDNFTNLVPMERSGSLRQSLRHAKSFLDRGYNALIFPEGTRSLTGDLAEFKPVIGYLALSSRIGILPVYVHGTYEALPKGSSMLHGREIGARIGRYLSIEELERMTEGMSKSEAYRLIALFVHHEIENLRDGAHKRFDVRAERDALHNERRHSSANEEQEAATHV